MRHVILVLGIVLLTCLSNQTASACMCRKIVYGGEPTTEAERQAADKQVRDFWLAEYRGALFTGEVVSIRRVSVKWLEMVRTMVEVTVKVDRYWRGVRRPLMTFYTGIGGGDCGVRYRKGDRRFFNPEVVSGRLETDICSVLNEGEVAALTKLLGEGQSFGNDN
jgi:hypothetical protein